MLLLLLLVFGGVLLWLKVYTNHGQKLELRNYIDKPYKAAAKDAKKRSFELIVKDSVHKVGIPGGMIISQNPPGGAHVKENRKIYVDVTKYNADEIPLSSISILYGQEFQSKKMELNNLDIKTEITGYKHDSGSPDHILEVRYEGRLIEGASAKKKKVMIKKGDTLQFVLSKSDGGQVNVPNLVCQPYGSLNFLLGSYNVRLGSVEHLGAITDIQSAYIVAQKPAFREGAMMNMGESVAVIVQQERPESCDD